MTCSRGTSNRNARGSAEDRRRRREWLVETYRANVDIVRRTSWRTYDEVVHEVPVGEGAPACRCYRCGELLTVDTVTVDRIIPGKRRNLGPLTEDERRQVKRAALAGYRVKNPDPAPALTAAVRGLERTLRAFGRALGELVPRPPQRLDVGHIFADRLYDLARDTYGSEAQHLTTAGSLGVTEFYGLPVVVTDRVPADVCALVDRDGTVRRVYTIDETGSPEPVDT